MASPRPIVEARDLRRRRGEIRTGIPHEGDQADRPIGRNRSGPRSYGEPAPGVNDPLRTSPGTDPSYFAGSGFFSPLGSGFGTESQAESIGALRPATGAVARLRRPSPEVPTIRIGPVRAQSQGSSFSVTDEAVGPFGEETTAGAITPSKCPSRPTSIASA